MKVWTIRHPPVDRKGRCVGQTQIQPLESTDESVAKVVASAPFVPERIFSSDLPRCSRLAEGLSTHWNVPLELTPSLREMHFGEWEGRTYDEIDATDNKRWRAWCADWRHGFPPGGESVNDLMSRISEWLAKTPLTETDLLVTHAGVIRVFQVLSGTPWDEAIVAQFPFLGWNVHQFLVTSPME